MNRVDRALDDWRREGRRWTILMIVLAVAFALCVAATAVFVSKATADTALTGTHRTLASGRSYWLTTTPETTDVLVIGLPGTALGAANTNDAFWVTGNPATTGWQRHAAAHGYTLALGESAGGRWNVGGGWPGGTQDDVDYLVQVVNDAEAQRSPPARSQRSTWPASVLVARWPGRLWRRGRTCSLPAGWPAGGQPATPRTAWTAGTCTALATRPSRCAAASAP